MSNTVTENAERLSRLSSYLKGGPEQPLEELEAIPSLLRELDASTEADALTTKEKVIEVLATTAGQEGKSKYQTDEQ